MKPLSEQYKELSTWAKGTGEDLPSSPSALARVAQSRFPSRAREWEELARMSTLRNSVMMTSSQFENAGQAVAKGLRENIGGTYPGAVASEFAGQLVSGLPQLGGAFAASRLPGLASVPAYVGLTGYQALDTMNRTGDAQAATAEAGSNLASMLGANALGRALVGRYGLSGAAEFGTHLATQALGNVGADVVSIAAKPTLREDGTVDLKQPVFGPGGRVEENFKFLADPVQAGAYALGQTAFGAAAAAGEMGLQAQNARVADVKARQRNLFTETKVGEELFPLDAAPQGGASLLNFKSTPLKTNDVDLLPSQLVADALARSPRARLDDSFGLPLEEAKRTGVQTQFLGPLDIPGPGDLVLKAKPAYGVNDALTESGRFVVRTDFDVQRAKALAQRGFNAYKVGDEMFVTNFASDIKPSLASTAKVYGGAQQLDLENRLLDRATRPLPEDSLWSLKAIVKELAPDEAAAHLRFMRATGANLSQAVQARTMGGLRGLYESGKDLVSFERKLDVQGALETLVHETSHGTLMRVRKLKPGLYQKVEDFVNGLTLESREWLLAELHTASGKGDYDVYVKYGADPTSYLAKRGEGAEFVGKERLVNTAEFTGRTLELLFSLASQGKRNKLRDWLESQPIPFVTTLFDLHSSVRSLFRREDPSLAKYLPKGSSEALYKTVSILGKELFNVENANRSFIRKWNELNGLERGLSLAGPDGSFEYDRDYPVVLKEADAITSFFSKENDVITKERMSGFVKNVLSKQFLISRYRFTQPLFDVLNRFQPARIEVPRIAIAEGAGTFANGVFTPLKGSVDDKLAHFDATLKELSQSKTQLHLLGSVWKRQAELRSRRLEAHLYKPEELKALGLSDNSVGVFMGMQRAIEATQKIRITQIRQEGSNAIGTMLWTYKQNVSKQGMVEVKNTWIRNQTAIQQLFARAEGVLQEQLGGKRKPREDEVAAFIYNSAEFSAVREAMQKHAVFGPRLTAADAAFLVRTLKLDALYFEKAQTWLRYLADVGYMPMVREGRFRVSAESTEGAKYYRDFDSVSEAKADAERLRKQGYDAAVFDTDRPEEFVSSFRSKDHFTLATKAVQQLEELKLTLDTVPDSAAKAQLVDVFERMKQSFRPLADEVRESLATRPEKYLQKRDLVEGFRNEQFLPSAFVFMENVLQDGQRSVSKSAADFLLADPIYAESSTPVDLRNYIQREAHYVFSGESTEWAGARKYIYFHSLVGSIKNLTQNLFQPALTLNNLLTQESGGNVGYALSTHMRAMKEVAAYNTSGKASSPYLSALMKTAEDTGVWNPRSLDVFLEGDATTYFKPSVNLNMRYAKYFANQVFDKVSWIAKETERFNRQVGFVAGVLLAKEKGRRTQTHELFEMGRILTDQANFVGSKAMRPGIFSKAGAFHGPLVLMSTLRMFQFNALNQLLALAVPIFNTKSVSLITGERYKNRAASAMALSYTLGALFVVAGLRGLPFAEDANNAIEEIVDKDLLKEGQELMRQHFLEPMGSKNASEFSTAFFHGIPAGFGVAAGPSLGMGSMIGLRPNFASQPGQGTSSVIASIAGGAAANIVDKYVDAGHEVYGAFHVLPENATWDERVNAVLTAGKMAAPTLFRQFTDFRDNTLVGRAVNPRTGDIYFERDVSRNPEDAITSAETVGSLLGYPLHKANEKRSFDAMLTSMKQEEGAKKDKIYDAIVVSLLASAEKGRPISKSSLEHWKNQLKMFDVSEADLLSAVTNRFLSATTAGRPLPSSPAGMRLFEQAASAYPDVSLPVQSPLATVRLRLHLAQQLGLSQLLTELQAQALPALRQAAKEQQLLQMGLNPQAVEQTLKGNTQTPPAPLPLPRNVQIVSPPLP